MPQNPCAGSVCTGFVCPGVGWPVSQAVGPSADDLEFYAVVGDLIGTPTELVTPDGARVAWTNGETTLWGAARGRGSSWKNADAPSKYRLDCPLRFPGQYADDETGLHYNRHRYYDPASARYTTADPLGLAPAPDPHSYVHNPTGWADPLGLAPCDDLSSSESLPAAFSHGTDFQTLPGGTATRGINFRPHADDPHWGLTPIHLEKHLFGDSGHSLSRIDPAGNTDIWFGHIQDLAGRAVTALHKGGVFDVIGDFGRSAGSEMYQLGIRLAPTGDDSYDLVTILTGLRGERS